MIYNLHTKVGLVIAVIVEIIIIIIIIIMLVIIVKDTMQATDGEQTRLI